MFAPRDRPRAIVSAAAGLGGGPPRLLAARQHGRLLGYPARTMARVFVNVREPSGVATARAQLVPLRQVVRFRVNFGNCCMPGGFAGIGTLCVGGYTSRCATAIAYMSLLSFLQASTDVDFQELTLPVSL